MPPRELVPSLFSRASTLVLVAPLSVTEKLVALVTSTAPVSAAVLPPWPVMVSFVRSTSLLAPGWWTRPLPVTVSTPVVAL